MKQTTRQLCFAALFLALGLLLPFLTGQIQQIGNKLLPMHLPVFLCGWICGWPYGLAVGLVLPLLRSVLFFMPPLYPVGIAMAAELATYGFLSGWVYDRLGRHFRCMSTTKPNAKQTLAALYAALLAAMVAGRIVWGLAEVLLLGLGESGFTWQMFVTGAFVNAIPGILLQLILLPALMLALMHTGLVPVRLERDVAHE